MNKSELNNAYADMEKLAKLVLGHFMGFIADTEDYTRRDSLLVQKTYYIPLRNEKNSSNIHEGILVQGQKVVPTHSPRT